MKGYNQNQNKVSIFKKMCNCLYSPFFKPPIDLNISVEKRPSTSKSILIIDQKRKLLVLDLDQTLVHCVVDNYAAPKGNTIININIGGEIKKINISVRNHCTEFIQTMSEIFDLALYTASMPEYADAVLEVIDPDNLIKIRLYRKDCIIKNEEITKDLTIFKRQMRQIILIDDLKSVLPIHSENGYTIKPYRGNKNDYELVKMIPFLQYLNKLGDVRPVESNYRIFKNTANRSATSHFIEQQRSYDKMVFQQELDSPQKDSKSHLSQSSSIIQKLNSSKQNLKSRRDKRLTYEYAQEPQQESMNSIKLSRIKSKKNTMK